EALETARTLASALDDPNPHVWCLVRLGMLAYITGSFSSAEGLLDRARLAARDADNLADYSMASAISVSLAQFQGRFATADRDGDQAQRAYRAAEYRLTASIVFPSLAAARAMRGDDAAAHDALDRWDEIQKGR